MVDAAWGLDLQPCGGGAPAPHPSPLPPALLLLLPAPLPPPPGSTSVAAAGGPAAAGAGASAAAGSPVSKFSAACLLLTEACRSQASSQRHSQLAVWAAALSWACRAVGVSLCAGIHVKRCRMHPLVPNRSAASTQGANGHGGKSPGLTEPSSAARFAALSKPPAHVTAMGSATTRQSNTATVHAGQRPPVPLRRILAMLPL